jgi:hypothetical protein
MSKFKILEMDDLWDLTSEELLAYETQINLGIAKLNMVRHDIDEVKLYTENESNTSNE